MNGVENCSNVVFFSQGESLLKKFSPMQEVFFVNLGQKIGSDLLPRMTNKNSPTIDIYKGTVYNREVLSDKPSHKPFHIVRFYKAPNAQIAVMQEQGQKSQAFRRALLVRHCYPSNVEA